MDEQARLKQRRERRQAGLSAATGLAGLAGLGAIGASAIIRRPGLASSIKNYRPSLPKKPVKPFGVGTDAVVAPKKKPFRFSSPETRQKFADDLKDKGYIAGSIAGGIGGISALNFANNQRRDASEIGKSLEDDRDNRNRAVAVGSVLGGSAIVGSLGRDAYREGRKQTGSLKYKALPKSVQRKLVRQGTKAAFKANSIPIAAGAAMIGGGAALEAKRRSRSFETYDGKGYFDHWER